MFRTVPARRKACGEKAASILERIGRLAYQENGSAVRKTSGFYAKQAEWGRQPGLARLNQVSKASNSAAATGCPIQ